MAGHWQPCDLSFSKSQSNFSSKFFERTNAGITVWSLSFCHSPITHHQWIMAIRDLEVNRSEIKLSCPSFCCFKTNHRAIIRPGTRGVSTATIGFILLLMNLHDKYQPPFWPLVKWRAEAQKPSWHRGIAIWKVFARPESFCAEPLKLHWKGSRPSGKFPDCQDGLERIAWKISG